MENSRRILVVDDDTSLASLLVKRLWREGYDAVAFGRANAALDSIALADIDLIITEITAVSGGKGLLRAVRDAGFSIPVVILAGSITEEEIESFREQGHVTLLRKPLKILGVLSAVEELLRERE